MMPVSKSVGWLLMSCIANEVAKKETLTGSTFIVKRLVADPLRKEYLCITISSRQKLNKACS